MAREKEIRVGDDAVVIPAHELSWHFVRSGGPELARDLEKSGYAGLIPEAA